MTIHRWDLMNAFHIHWYTDFGTSPNLGTHQVVCFQHVFSFIMITYTVVHQTGQTYGLWQDILLKRRNKSTEGFSLKGVAHTRRAVYSLESNIGFLWNIFLAQFFPRKFCTLRNLKRYQFLTTCLNSMLRRQTLRTCETCMDTLRTGEREKTNLK